MTKYGLPEPDHKLLSAHPTISDDLLTRLGHGDITVKPNIERLDGDKVHFVDGTVEQIDVVVYCTGYRITFPFLDERRDQRAGQRDLAVPPRRRSGPSRAVLHRAGAAARRDHAAGRGAVGVGRRPARRHGHAAVGRARCGARSTKYTRSVHKRYVASKRHTIQVDFLEHFAELKKERPPARRRAGRVRPRVAPVALDADVLDEQLAQPGAAWQRPDLPHRPRQRRTGRVHDGQVPLRPRHRGVDERTRQHPARLGRHHEHDGGELRTLRAVHGDRPAVQQVGQRLALHLGRAGRELDRHRAVVLDLGHHADLAVGIAERLGLEVVRGRDDPVADVEAPLARARIQPRLERRVQPLRAGRRRDAPA